MKHGPRIYYTDTQKAVMWEWWRAGDSLQSIAQLFDRNSSSIQRILAETGGIRSAQHTSLHPCLLSQETPERASCRRVVR
jgi:hypothetical protein